MILVVDIVEQQNTANQILMVTPFLCGEYALKGPARSTWLMQNGGVIINSYFEIGPIATLIHLFRRHLHRSHFFSDSFHKGSSFYDI